MDQPRNSTKLRRSTGAALAESGGGRHFRAMKTELCSTPPAGSPAAQSATLSRWSGTIGGNALTVIGSGSERLTDLLQLIGGARTSLKLLFYIFLDDEAGTRVMDALVAAAERGVDVVLLYDCFGSNACKHDFFQRLRDAGGEASAFANRWRPSYLIRNHQKLVIADDTRLMSGGFNIATDYFGDCEDECWQDLGFLLEGPAVAPMLDYFDQLHGWMHTKRRRWRQLRHLIQCWDRRKGSAGVPRRRAASTQQGALTWLVGGPTEFRSPLVRQLRSDMASGQRLDMVMAYFSPSSRMLRPLGALARRGHARLVLASKTDNGATIGAARILYNYLFKRRVRIFEFDPRKLHTKLIVIDDIVYLGSANYDVRSMRINLELMLRIEDGGLAAAMRALVDAYVAESSEIIPAEHRRRLGLINRVRWGASYLLVAVLDYGVTRRLNFGIAG